MAFLLRPLTNYRGHSEAAEHVAERMLIITALVFGTTLGKATPNPPQPALKTIQRVRATPVCSTLRENLGVAVAGLLTNDRLARQGQVLMANLGFDVPEEPQNFSLMGGAGTAATMDTVRMSYLVSALVKNLGQIDALLQDTTRFPAQARNESERQLLLARAGLQAVADRQRAELNLLSGTSISNASNDLASRRNPLGGSGPSGTPVQITAPKALAQEVALTQQTEANASQAVVSLAASCR